jgi:hypothetical protein
MSADQRSTLDFVEFRNTGHARNQSWQLTGAVTFYQADVDIRNTEFIGTIAEDALNVIKSDFVFQNSTIESTRSDGFDADFSTGLVKNSRFSSIGGDGIDFSGSEIRTEDSVFVKVHDKAISAGEATQISIERVQVSDSGTGVAIKDGSIGKISHSEFSDIHYSTLMSYQKKVIYGGSSLIADNIRYDAHELALIAQKGSQLSIDERTVKPIKIDIEKLYEKGYMKK